MSVMNYRFLGSGTFGCTFSPALPCLPTNNMTLGAFQYVELDPNKAYLTKVVNGAVSGCIEEVLIGQMISEEPTFETYFAPVLQTCTADLSLLGHEALVQCPMITNDTDSSTFVVNTIRNVGTDSLTYYLADQFSNGDSESVTAIFKTHTHLLSALIKLQNMKNPIVHFDMKGNNVIFDEKIRSPIIIDFGFSFTKTKLLKSSQDIKLLGELFWSYNEEKDGDIVNWCIEVDLISYITQRSLTAEGNNFHSKITRQNIENLFFTVDAYIIKSEYGNMRLINSAELEMFRYRYKSYLALFLNMSWVALIDDLLSTWHHWDNYSLSLTYATYLERHFDRMDLLLPRYTDLLKESVLALPGKQPTPMHILSLLYALSSNSNSNSYKNSVSSPPDL
jgi:tRNA A-37 threonylcarbamoyl transferase component Bud32